jgi:hypothetical protein
MAISLSGCFSSTTTPETPLIESGVNLAFTPSQAECMQDYMAICNNLLFRLNGVGDTATNTSAPAAYAPTDLHAYLLYCEPRPGSEIDRGDPCERLCGVSVFTKQNPVSIACSHVSPASAPPKTEWCAIFSNTQEQYDQLDSREKEIVVTLRRAIDTEKEKLCQQLDAKK